MPIALPIQTERLLIRPLQAADIPALVALWTDPEVTQHMGGPRDPAKVREVLDEELREDSGSDYGLWPVIEQATGHLVGDCGLTEKEVDGRRETEIIYVFASKAWGKGYATEAAAAIRDAAFTQLRLSRLIALIDPANAASARVAEKLGLRFEGETVRPGGVKRHVYAAGSRR